MKFFKVGVLTLCTAFIFGFIVCGESSAHPGLDGIDEHGRHVNVIDVDKYLKNNPYKPPVKKKPAPSPKYKPFQPKKAIKKTVVGAVVGGASSAIPSVGVAAGPGAVIGGATGLITYSAEWAYDNAEYIAVKWVDKQNKECVKAGELLKKNPQD